MIPLMAVTALNQEQAFILFSPAVKAIQRIDSILISASILPPKIKRNPPVTANFIFASSSLNPTFVHFKPSTDSTVAMNPKRTEVIIKARHA